MKKRLIASLTASVMFFFTASASADVIHIWTCELNDGKTFTDAVDVSSAWLKVAKSMEGGEDFEVFLEFPFAANVGDGSFSFVLVAADAKTWGVWFNDPDPDSPIVEANATSAEVAACSGSSLWNSVEIEKRSRICRY